MARRTYVAGALWLAGAAWARLSGLPDLAGWLRVRLDGPGLVLLGAALLGGYNFFPKAVRAVRRLRLDMNFLMTAAIIGALFIGEPIEAAAIAALFSVAELLEAAAVTRSRRISGWAIASVFGPARRSPLMGASAMASRQSTKRR